MNHDHFTEQELTRKKLAELHELCTQRGLLIASKKAKQPNIDVILRWQEEQLANHEENGGEEQRNDQRDQNAIVVVDGNANDAADAEPRGVKRPLGIESTAGPLEQRLLTTDQLQAVVSQMMGQQGSGELLNMRTELQGVMVRRAAESWFPDRAFKRRKHQHEYDTIRDIARTVYRLEHAGSRGEEQGCIEELRKMVIARGATIVTAEELGWNVARHVEQEKETFMTEAKPIIKEARAKARKSDFCSTTTKNTQVSNTPSFFPRSLSVRYPTNSGATQRLGTPSGQRMGINNSKTCWNCGGNHLKKDCPQRKKN
jgi:hypothetical protein